MGGNANLLWCWGQQTGSSLVLACRLEFHLLTRSSIFSITECPGKENWNWAEPKLNEYPWALPSGLLKLQEYSLLQNMGNSSSVKRKFGIFLPCRKFGSEHEDPCFKLHFCQRFPSVFINNPNFRTTSPVCWFSFTIFSLIFVTSFV